jgi:large subunit ribosomal protein L15
MNITDVHKIGIKRKKRWRVGRGESSGSGKTSGRGHKGQKARSGVSFRPYFEGGQMPLVRRLPKRGFSNARFKKLYNIANVGSFDIFQDGDVVDINKLKESGLVKKELDGLKILGDGELHKRLIVKAHKFSNSAKEKIEKAGGTIEIIKL